ncbi:MAG: DNA mismatch repair endonuclease MutL [Myxococcales bacterium]|nr:DNA mismatch repair endonuclease MutL [Myxococcales bacterium]
MRRLPDALIDQIAAGEVVERPASVVKELVENALDAGAERLRVEVRNGGCDWIAVTDDGGGMTPEDARLALQRHATSKISAASDLQRIGTYGFRGEALPAIASVSSLRLRTRTRDAESAFELRVRAGEIGAARAVSGPIGTRVEVADLFAAIPARRKFLKSAQTEWGHIADWLARSALALPSVHFDILRDERAALAWPAARDPLDRIATILGEREASALQRVDYEEGRARVEGFVSRPDRHRPTLAGVYLFVNRRPVRDRVLQHALVDVYRDLLPRGRFPSALLFLEIPLEAVDVNVHPAKWEVRFADSQWAHRLVRNAVLAAIERRSWIGASAIAEGPAETPARRGSAPPYAASSAPRPASAPAAQGEMGDWSFATHFAAAERGAGAAEMGVRFADLRLLGQLLATYLIVEAKDRLLLVDQHAAHERVLYERLRADWIGQGVERQGLLAPVPVALDPGVLGALEGGAESLERLGFELEPFGEDTLVVRAVPALLAEREPADLVRGLLEELASGGGQGRAAVRALPEADRIFATLACHASRRRGDVLDAREQRALLDALDAIPWAPNCPHGRPVCVPIELAEIERRFARR